MASNKIDITEIDFDNLKESLKTFLQSQSEFKDFDFEGSGMNVLLDVLAYNSHYSAFHANMVANEMFLNSASIRSSVVDRARHLNYTPRSYTSAKAQLDILFNPTSTPTSITINKDTKFITVIDGVTYTFTTLASPTILPVSGVFLLNGLVINEGVLLTYDIVKDSSDATQRFIIPNKKVDTDTIKVTIQNSISDTTQTIFNQATSINNVVGTSDVFWVHEVEGELYQLEFGNGIVGSALNDGNIVKIEYLVTNGSVANFASSFSSEGSIGGYTGNEVSFTVSQNSAGGGEIEGIEVIKFLAPKLFSTQGRAVTAQDYVNILLDERSDIESITVWGGEDNIPQKFGEVFIAIKPKNSLTYSDATKLDIERNVLQSRNIVAINPTIVDAEFTYIRMTTSIVYNGIQITGTVSELQTAAQAIIEDYFDNTLSRFDNKLRTSVLTGLIDNSDVAILNSRSSFIMEKRIEPTLTVSQTQTLLFNNAIEPQSVNSNKFVIGGNIGLWYTDDGVGNIITNNLVGENVVVVDASAGTIDYDTGLITLADNTIASIEDGGDDIVITATPTIADLTPVNSQIITMDKTDVNSLVITMISDDS